MNDILIEQIQGSFSVFASLTIVGKPDNLSCNVQIIQQNSHVTWTLNFVNCTQTSYVILRSTTLKCFCTRVLAYDVYPQIRPNSGAPSVYNQDLQPLLSGATVVSTVTPLHTFHVTRATGNVINGEG